MLRAPAAACWLSVALIFSINSRHNNNNNNNNNILKLFFSLRDCLTACVMYVLFTLRELISRLSELQ